MSKNKEEQTPDDKSSGSKRGGVPSKQSISLKAQGLAEKALKVWEEALKDPNANIRLGAANKIMDKAIPDMKAMEVSGPDGGPIQVVINTRTGFTPPMASVGGSAQIQSISLAQASEEDIDSTG